jgi:hypothetical protein
VASDIGGAGDSRRSWADGHITGSATLLALCGGSHKASKGTKDCCRQAIEAGIPTYLIDSDKAKPKQLRADDPRLE